MIEECEHQWRDTYREIRRNIVKEKHGYSADVGWEQRCIKCNASRLTLERRKNLPFLWNDFEFRIVMCFILSAVFMFILLVI